jgi:hypothetical protein
MRRIRIILLVVWLAAPAGPVAACPNCRESVDSTTGEPGQVTQPDAEDRTATFSDGFNASIWVMLSGLGLSLGLIATIVTRTATGGCCPPPRT